MLIISLLANCLVQPKRLAQLWRRRLDLNKRRVLQRLYAMDNRRRVAANVPRSEYESLATDRCAQLSADYIDQRLM